MAALRLIGYPLVVLVACFVLYVAADVARSFYRAYAQQSLMRIAPNEVRVDELRLLPKPVGNYRLRAQVPIFRRPLHPLFREGGRCR